jgi:undecaprenyl-diphosphatase
MSLLEAIVLGIVQGITEFLPISSTAHLRFVPALVGWDDPGAAFTAITQVGTIAAVVVYFRHELVRIASAWVRGLGRPLRTLPFDARLGWFIIIGTVPLVVFGAIFADDVETGARSLRLLAWAMIGLGILLLIAELTARHVRPLRSLRLPDAIVIGLAQVGALVPGASRSGVTLTAGLFVGLTREAAARYSFLLSVPAVTAAGVYELYAEVVGATAIGVSVGPVIVATILAFLFGYAAIAGLLAFLRRHSTLPFVVYRVAVGALILALLQADAIS